MTVGYPENALFDILSLNQHRLCRFFDLMDLRLNCPVGPDYSVRATTQSHTVKISILPCLFKAETGDRLPVRFGLCLAAESGSRDGRVINPYLIDCTNRQPSGELSLVVQFCIAPDAKLIGRFLNIAHDIYPASLFIVDV